MSSEKGALLKCNRCGKTVFLPLKGKEYFDGGYSSADKFEKAPEGWQRVHIEKYVDLCPACSIEWGVICKEFMEVENAEEEN